MCKNYIRFLKQSKFYVYILIHKYKCLYNRKVWDLCSYNCIFKVDIAMKYSLLLNESIPQIHMQNNKPIYLCLYFEYQSKELSEKWEFS